MYELMFWACSAGHKSDDKEMFNPVSVYNPT